MILPTKANNKGADQTARMRRLCADGKAGLLLCWSQTPEDRFPRIETHIVCVHEKILSLVHLNACGRHKKETTFSGQKISVGLVFIKCFS